MRTLALSLLTVGLLALPACQKEGNSLDEIKDAAGNLKASGGEMVSALKDLDMDTVEKIGQISAKLESAPAEAKRMLEERGWTREHFDKLVAQIKDNPELNKLFEAARKAAAGH